MLAVAQAAAVLGTARARCTRLGSLIELNLLQNLRSEDTEMQLKNSSLVRSCATAHGPKSSFGAWRTVSTNSCRKLLHSSSHVYRQRVSESLPKLRFGCFSSPAAPTTVARSCSTSPAIQTSSPPPAEIEATCLRCTLGAISGDLAEELGDVLLAMGAQSVVVQEHRPPGAPEQPIYEDGCEGGTALWDRCDLIAHFPLEADVEGTLALAAVAVGLPPPQPSDPPQQQPHQQLPDQQHGVTASAVGAVGSQGEAAAAAATEEEEEEEVSVAAGGDGGVLTYRIEPVANAGWVEQIKASYVPLQLAEDLWITPEWGSLEGEEGDEGEGEEQHGEEGQQEAQHGQGVVNILLQPGVAFGTGEHPTTRLCLLALRQLAAGGGLAGAAVCDYGTGSGVLAIAALKYGAARAVGTDIDSLAVKAAQRNGALNGFQPPTFTVFQCGGGIHDPEPLAAAAAAAAGGGGAAAAAGGAAAVAAAAGVVAAAGGGAAAAVVGGVTAAAATAATAAVAAAATGTVSGGAAVVVDDATLAATLAAAGGDDLQQFDLVVANILRGPLVELQPRLSGYVRPGGRLLLSGILAEQAPEVIAAYSPQFGDFSMQVEQQWAALMATKRGSDTAAATAITSERQ
ncbi:hypothetical protein Agub_g6668 [Astrephomene gubernaculifera]|uniref:ETFB lysine methyltransferase n=1 Tax=Astrephomene gubernaculifera TaxID=47775 RepID=A0AAD3DRD8_9CHLO|nr:hypothetical protein Agub_g6668 [Astrephomene gubernaculifera]